MRKISFIFLLALLATLHTSCSEHPKYQQFVEIPMLKWTQENVLRYTFDVKEPKPDYRLALLFRYASHIPYKAVKVSLEMTSPTGKKFQKDYTIPFKDEKGQHLGEVMHEAADLTKTIEEKFALEETGKYQFAIKENLDNVAVIGIQEVGVLLYAPISKAK